MAKRQNRIGAARKMMKDAAALPAERTAKLANLKAQRKAILASRKAITKEIYTSFVEAYAVGAWFALPDDAVTGETPSATDMLKYCAGISADTPSTDKAVVVEVNYSNNVRKWSHWAVEAGVSKGKGNKAKKADVATILKYVSGRLTAKAVPPTTADVDKVKALLRVVQEYAGLVAKANREAKAKADAKAKAKADKAKAKAFRKAALLAEADTREHGAAAAG